MFQGHKRIMGTRYRCLQTSPHRAFAIHNTELNTEISTVFSA